MNAIKVLIVEDSPTQRLNFTVNLEQMGFLVSQASNGSEALKVCRTDPPDIVLSDILMPVMDGFELCHHVKRDPELSKIPIVLQTSSYQASADKDFGILIGADNYIYKNSQPEEMAKTINEVVARRSARTISKTSDQVIDYKNFMDLHAKRLIYRLIEQSAALEEANVNVRKERDRAELYLDIAGVLLVSMDRDFNVTLINKKGCRVLGYDLEEIRGRNWLEMCVPPAIKEEIRDVLSRTESGDSSLHEYEYRVLTKSGEERLISWQNVYLYNGSEEIIGILSSGEDITEQRMAEIALQQSEEKYRSLFENVPVGVYRATIEGKILETNNALVNMLGVTNKTDLLKKNIEELFTDKSNKRVFIDTVLQSGSAKNLQFQLVRLDGQPIETLVNARGVKDQGGKVIALEGTVTDITELTHTTEALKKRNEEISRLYQAGNQLNKSLNFETLYDQLYQVIQDVVPCDMMIVSSYSPQKRQIHCRRIWLEGNVIDTSRLTSVPLQNSGVCSLASTIQLEESQIDNNFNGDTSSIIACCSDESDQLMRLDSRALHSKPVSSVMHILIKTENNISGTMQVYSYKKNAFTEDHLRFMDTLSVQIGAAISNTRLFEQTRRRMQQLISLREIDKAISGSFSLEISLRIIAETVISQLDVDAGDVLVFNRYSQMLEYEYGQGFRGAAMKKAEIKIGEGLAGRIALTRERIIIPNVNNEFARMTRIEEIKKEQFVTYIGIPLIAKGKLLGVLEVFNRTPLAMEDDWLNYLETLAGQTAIAIDNYELFSNLQSSNFKLSIAYDATIEGWSRALDLRDQETEGHTQRVTEMTMSLASFIGIGEDKMIHVKHGALLHDIGKMGIPDSILLKPGPLSDEEWVTMRRHPQIAYDLLLPIDYLRPALDIPHCHHEKWDGTGYPQSLKGEQIPLVARIFAVVDVWDALSSDRPYRDAWPLEDVIAYIKEQAGKHFDPEIVTAFLKLLETA